MVGQQLGIGFFQDLLPRERLHRWPPQLPHWRIQPYKTAALLLCISQQMHPMALPSLRWPDIAGNTTQRGRKGKQQRGGNERPQGRQLGHEPAERVARSGRTLGSAARFGKQLVPVPVFPSRSCSDRCSDRKFGRARRGGVAIHRVHVWRGGPREIWKGSGNTPGATRWFEVSLDHQSLVSPLLHAQTPSDVDTRQSREEWMGVGGSEGEWMGRGMRRHDKVISNP